MRKPKFTIITVCYNAEKYIKETIESLLSQTCADYEYIIKDGLSIDNTLKIASSLLEGKENVQIVSSSDKGIYDAMNQAVEMAKGEYVYFLNAGDCFCNKEVLKKTASAIDEKEADIVYGNVLLISDKKEELRTYGKICRRKIYFLIGACICHQAMFVKRKLFEEKQFDTNYRVCADREWQLFFLNRRATFSILGFEVASVLEDGFSKSNEVLLEKEVRKCIMTHYRYGLIIYDMIVWLKKNKVIHEIMRKLINLF